MSVLRLKGDARTNVRRRLSTAAAVSGLAFLVGCSHVNLNDFDSAANVSKKDYEALLGRRQPGPQPRGEEPPIPQLQSVLAAPSAPELADTRRVSLAVTETTPLRDILIELSRKAEVDLELDPRISGGIIMTATDRPLIDVIDRIADLAELRYSFSKNVLRVEVDDPYMEQYQMDVLNIARTSTSESSSQADAASAAQVLGGGGGGGGNKSSASVSSSTRSDFWTTISANVQQILSGIQSRRPRQAAEQIPAAFVPQAEAKSAAAAGAAPAAAPAPGGAAAGGAGAGGVAGAVNRAAGLQARQGQLAAIEAMDQPKPQEQQASTGEANKVAGTDQGSSQFSINPQAGIITVFANKRQQKAIERYLRDVRASVGQQVLIEAKILEVTLDDEYRAGINWQALLGPVGRGGGTSLVTDFTRGIITSDISDPTVKIGVSNLNNTLVAGAQLVKQFGTVRTLSNPRLTVLNNQVALLKVAKNQVFFELKVTTTDATTTAAGKTTIDSQIKTVPVGIVMAVQPAVDPITRRISLNLRPSITRITGFVNDPGVALTIAQFNTNAQNNNPNLAISSPIPIIEARELDSLVTLESGQTVIMGGLMQDESQNSREGIPGAMDVPVVGQLLSQNVKSNKISELVIFIRATLANARGTVTDEDIRLYKTFTPDPRPVTF